MNDYTIQLHDEALLKLDEWKKASRIEDDARLAYKKAWAAYASSMAAEIGFSVGDIIEQTHQIDANKNRQEITSGRKRVKILRFDVDIIGDFDVPGYPKYAIKAEGMSVNKRGEVIPNRDSVTVNLNHSFTRWTKIS